MKKNSKKSFKISNVFMALILLYALSMLMARFWAFSGWSMVAALTFTSAIVLMYAAYKDTDSVKPALIPIAFLLIIVGLRFAMLGSGIDGNIQNDGNGFVGSVMTTLGGALLGYRISIARKTNGKK